jgi:hypothetical protein
MGEPTEGMRPSGMAYADYLSFSMTVPDNADYEIWYYPPESIVEISDFPILYGYEPGILYSNVSIGDPIDTDIVWGDLDGTIGSLTPTSTTSGTYYPGGLNPGTAPDIIPTNAPNHSGGVSVPTNPFTDIVKIGAGFWDMEEINAWFFLGMIFVIGSFILVAKLFQHLGWAGATACIVLGAFTASGVYPSGMMIFAVLGLIACIAMELRG